MWPLNDKVTLGSGGVGKSITLDGNTNTINGGSYVQFGGTDFLHRRYRHCFPGHWMAVGNPPGCKYGTGKDNGTQNGNYVTGLSNTSWDPLNVGYSPSRAATEGQLRDVESRSGENPITFLGEP